MGGDDPLGGLNAAQARRRAERIAQAHRFIDETVGSALISASDRGETVVDIALTPVDVPREARFVGRIYEQTLAEALAAGGAQSLAVAVPKLVTLGFGVSGLVEDGPSEVPVAQRHRRIGKLTLDMAPNTGAASGRVAQAVQGVALPVAERWRARAEAALAVRKLEKVALVRIAAQVETGVLGMALTWKDFAETRPSGEHVQRLAELLRARGFRVDVRDGGATLKIDW